MVKMKRFTAVVLSAAMLLPPVCSLAEDVNTSSYFAGEMAGFRLGAGSNARKKL